MELNKNTQTIQTFSHISYLHVALTHLTSFNEQMLSVRAKKISEIE